MSMIVRVTVIFIQMTAIKCVNLVAALSSGGIYPFASI